jgi:N-acetylglucosamine-6-phosphate deacetylase
LTRPNSTTTLLRNAQLVLPDRTTGPANLLIQAGRIVRVLESSAEPLPAADQAIDLSGSTIFPGFIDVHIHGAVGVDTMAATAADLERVSQFLASQGVTGWLPTFVPAPMADYQRSIAAINEAAGLNNGARILGVHYEGPFVNSLQCGALRTEFFRTFSSPADLDTLPLLSANAQTGKHLITVAPEIAGGIPLVAELVRRGWIVSLGHTRAGFALLDQALAAGAHHLTHFMNAMAPLHHRAPGPVAWGLARNDVTCDLIADGIHLDPEILRLLLKVKGAAGLALISDAIAAAGMGDGAYEIWGETIVVKDGRTSNGRGAIAGSVITMLAAVQLMLSLGATEVEVGKMAATNPARLLGLAQECGTIDEGKRADLVALDKRREVVLTMIAGRQVFRSG